MDAQPILFIVIYIKVDLGKSTFNIQKRKDA